MILEQKNQKVKIYFSPKKETDQAASSITYILCFCIFFL